MSLDPAGFLRGGPSASMEWTKGNSNTLLFLSLPTLAMNSLEKGNFGMGFGLTINYYKPTEKGGFFIGPTIEYNLSKLPEPLMRYKNSSEWEAKEMKYINDFVLGANIGYKFVRESGAYFRIGIAGGLKLSSRPNEIYPARDYSDGKEVSEWVSYNNPYDPEGGYYTMRTQNGIVGTKKSVPAAFFYKPSVTVGYIFK